MRLHQIMDLLMSHNVRPANATATVDNIGLSRLHIDPAEEARIVQRNMAAKLALVFADDVMTSADWATTQRHNGIRFDVQAFILPQRQLFELLRAAYALGAQDHPLTPMDYRS